MRGHPHAALARRPDPLVRTAGAPPPGLERVPARAAPAVEVFGRPHAPAKPAARPRRPPPAQRAPDALKIKVALVPSGDLPIFFGFRRTAKQETRYCVSVHTAKFLIGQIISRILKWTIIK